MIIHVAFIKGDDAILGEIKLAPFNHVVFLAIAERYKFRDVCAVVQANTEFDVRRILAMCRPGKYRQ